MVDWHVNLNARESPLEHRLVIMRAEQHLHALFERVRQRVQKPRGYRIIRVQQEDVFPFCPLDARISGATRFLVDGQTDKIDLLISVRVILLDRARLVRRTIVHDDDLQAPGGHL